MFSESRSGESDHATTGGRRRAPAALVALLEAVRPGAASGSNAITRRLGTGIYAVYLPETYDAMIQSWDCAFKDLRTSDYVVGQVQAGLGSRRYLLDQVRSRLDMPRTVQAIRAMSAKYPKSGAKLVEDKANGPAVIQSLQHEISGLIEVNPEGGAMSRARAASPEAEAGDWHLPHPGIAPWVLDFVEECASFPNGRHDDQADAWSQGGNYIRRQVIEPNIRFFDLGPFYRPGYGSLSSRLTRDWLRG